MVEAVDRVTDEPATIIFGITHPVTGDPARIDLPLPVAWAIYQTVSTVGSDAVQHLVWLGAGLVRDEFSEDETLIQRLRQTITQIIAQCQDEDLLLHHSYVLLRARHITYQQAADLMTGITKKRVQPNTLRMRIDRYAERRGLSKVEQRKRGALRTDEG